MRLLFEESLPIIGFVNIYLLGKLLLKSRELQSNKTSQYHCW